MHHVAGQGLKKKQRESRDVWYIAAFNLWKCCEGMNKEDYGMCCSKEMADRCAGQYEELAAWERHKEKVTGILVSAAALILLLFLQAVCR